MEGFSKARLLLKIQHAEYVRFVAFYAGSGKSDETTKPAKKVTNFFC